MADFAVRYIVDDVTEAVTFYTDCLGFEVEVDRSRGFAALVRGDLRLFVNGTGGPGGASQEMPDGARPEPGGWNRFQIVVRDLEEEVDSLRKKGATFRNDIVTGRGGAQILLQDPSGNLIELFQPAS